jgi:hypothetical protein
MSYLGTVRQEPKEMTYLEKEFKMKTNVVGNQFMEPPDHGKITRINLIGEIVEASGFELETIYIDHQ